MESQQKPHDELDTKKKKLFEDAMKDNWEDVYAAYINQSSSGGPDLQKEKIDKSEDTVLHVAVLKGNKLAVQKLVGRIEPGREKDVLGAENEKGNTPLHLAAALGVLEMCRDLAGKFPGAIKMENKDKETPYFLAARFGKKDVFLHLHSICSKMPEVAGWPEFLFRTSEGETILHSAINGEYFELAYEIIQKYKPLSKERNVIDQRDSQGYVPLHVLATKPHAFESGNPPGISDWLLYQCVILNMHKIEAEETDPSCHPNYRTCMRIINGIQSQLELLQSFKKRPPKDDVEKAETIGSTPSEGQEKTESHTPKPNKNGGAAESREHSVHEETESYYPSSYETFIHFLKFTFKLLFVVLGFGIASISKIQHRKKKHYWANLVMKELIERDTTYHSDGDGKKPKWPEQPDRPEKPHRPEEFDLFAAELSPEAEATALFAAELSPEAEATASKPQAKNEAEYATTLDAMGEKKETRESSLRSNLKDLGTKIVMDMDEFLNKHDLAVQDVDGPGGNTKHLRLTKRDARRSGASETPFLVAARTGITEIVDGLLEKYPTAIHDMDPDEKNAMLLAVEHRQTDVCNLLLGEKIILKERLMRQVDNEDNNALHLAATCGEHHPRSPGAAMRMQWEMKWYEFVKKKMPPEYRSRRNKKHQTPRQVLIKSHEELAAKAGDWITKTSESCSVVAALIATVAFATSATIPGGNQDSGEPNLKNHPLFHVFAISSLLALCLSVTSLVLFLTILTSRFQVDDFTKSLPRKLLFGLSSLFASIAAILVSFCAGHFFLLQQSVKNAAYPIYFATCLPVTYFGLAQLHLYIDLITCIFRKQPQASYIIN